MRCAWKELLAVLPLWMRKDVDQFVSEPLKEIRLRVNAQPELITEEDSFWLEQYVTQDDVNYTVNAASRYSPWSASSTAMGYITIAGGHRLGLCGEAVMRQGEMTGFRVYQSLCIRVARDYAGIATGLEKIKGSVLILGPPGWGKTTLLRDLIRQIGNQETVGVVDERGELFPEGFDKGKRVDILTGCPKENGIFLLLRTMGPSSIAVDEITDQKDAIAILHAANCGVRLLASAHADSLQSFRKRAVYSILLENHVFDAVLILKKDFSYTVERMTEWATNGSVRY